MGKNDAGQPHTHFRGSAHPALVNPGASAPEGELAAPGHAGRRNLAANTVRLGPFLQLEVYLETL